MNLPGRRVSFLKAARASAETAEIGSIKLVPSETAIKDLRTDYDHMKDMIYGEKPSFNEIMAAITSLEKEINNLKNISPVEQN